MTDGEGGTGVEAAGVRLSVVLTIVEGGPVVARCLRALTGQDGAPVMEVLVPYDDSVARVGELSREFPGVRFLPLGAIVPEHPIDGPAGQHELYDRRRAAGLAAARGELIAILEDRGVPWPDWARRTSEVHAEQPHAVIGGAVENGRDRWLNWAVYVCDFSRYQLPLPEGPADWVTDVNICYKRAALDGVRDLWRERYHETTVHWALVRGGATLHLTPRMVVEQQRDGLRLGPLLRERFAWGRLFAFTRAREASVPRRLVWAALAPVLPAVLLVRHARILWAKRVTFGKFVAASPAVLLLLAAWSFGEMAGYLRARP